MKKSISLAIFTVILATILAAQSSGGTSIEHKFEQIEAQAEQFAEDIEAKAEASSERWEKRAERWEQRATDFAERMEDKWGNRSIKLEGKGRKMSMPICPEISYLGIEARALSSEKAKKLGFDNRYGSYVSKVMAKSVAEVAGLRAFDYIYGVDEQRTSNNQSLSDILEDYETGDEVTLFFVRKGQKMSAKAKLEDADFGEEDNMEQRPFLGVSPADENFFNELDGVSVDVVEKSTAEEMGLKVGDLITAINGFPILDWEDVTVAIQNTKPGQAIEVNFKRDDKELSAKGTIKAYNEVYPAEDNGNWNLNIDWDETSNIDETIGDDWGNEDQNEDRAFIGIYTEMISKTKANKLGFDNPYGAYITGIIEGSGAAKAGLKPFDYIYGFDEYRAGEQQNLGFIVKKYQPGDKATVHYIRKGKKATSSLVFTKAIKGKKDNVNSCEDGFFGIIQKSNDEDDGVTISPVKNSTATELGLEDGDVITQINGYPMLDWQDITTAIGMLKPGETISVDFQRNGKAMKGTKPLKSLADTKKCPNCDCGEKESVVLATPPNGAVWGGWTKNIDGDDSPKRLDMKNARVSTGNLSSDDVSALRSKGVNLSNNASLDIENLRLTPNASSGLFSFEFNLPSNGSTVVRFYNTNGRVLYEYDLGSFNGKFNDNVDLGQNGTGNYFLEISQGSKSFTKKITLAKD